MKHLWTWLAFALAAVLATGAYLGLTLLLLMIEGWARVMSRKGKKKRSGTSDSPGTA